uniref:G103 VD Superfamily S precursor conopeptide n=1 Tax=Conus geographus TaxID=6491 RepID=X5IH12_CONGE|nr:G103_VD_Superfamily_S_precursor_conopeptide [Conus geographus]
MMSKMGAMFVLLLLFTLASSLQEGDVQARKTRLKSDFYRALARDVGECTHCGGADCTGSCTCTNWSSCVCMNFSSSEEGECGCTCFR